MLFRDGRAPQSRGTLSPAQCSTVGDPCLVSDSCPDLFHRRHPCLVSEPCLDLSQRRRTLPSFRALPCPVSPGQCFTVGAPCSVSSPCPALPCPTGWYTARGCPISCPSGILPRAPQNPLRQTLLLKILNFWRVLRNCNVTLTVIFIVLCCLV